MVNQAQRSIFGLGTSIASSAVVIASVASVSTGLVAAPIALLLCAGIYLIVLIGGTLLSESLGRGQRTLTAALVVLGCLTVWTSRGSSILLLMPLISLVVLWFSLRSAIALTVLLGLFVMLARSHYGVGTALGAFSDYGSAAVFTVIFSRLMLREHLAAARIERLAADVDAQNRQLSAYAAQIRDLATVQERNRIAREIHDSLGHYLTTAHVQLEVARTALANGGMAATEHVARAQELLHQGLGEVRKSVMTLRSSTTDRPLRAALRELIEEVRCAGLLAELHVRGAARPLGPAIEFALYRAAQEGLTNVRRHADAHRADLRIEYRNDEVELLVEDDGPGADAIGEGFGLVGIRERIAQVGGVVEIAKAETGGLSLRVRIPT